MMTLSTLQQLLLSLCFYIFQTRTGSSLGHRTLVLNEQDGWLEAPIRAVLVENSVTSLKWNLQKLFPVMKQTGGGPNFS